MTTPRLHPSAAAISIFGVAISLATTAAMAVALPAVAPGTSAPARASSAQWGTRSAPASAPADDDDDRANGDYFHDFAALMVRVRSVGWLADICSEAFPGSAALDRQAYADWLDRHRAFVAEMDAQFALIDRRWATTAPTAASQGITTAALQSRLEANRAALREDFLARPAPLQRKRCDAYPTLLLSRPFDLEHAQADLVQTVRQGPPPT